MIPLWLQVLYPKKTVIDGRLWLIDGLPYISLRGTWSTFHKSAFKLLSLLTKSSLPSSTSHRICLQSPFLSPFCPNLLHHRRRRLLLHFSFSWVCRAPLSRPLRSSLSSSIIEKGATSSFCLYSALAVSCADLSPGRKRAIC